MRIFLWITGIAIILPVTLFTMMLVYPRPTDNTPAWVFEGDSSGIDYCRLPDLDGTGIKADDVPQGHTPGCGWTEFPQPILRDCTEPLSEGAADLRGLWQEVGDSGTGHIERVEQCGNRVVVTASGLIHDLTTDGRFSGASNDVRPLTIGPFNFCIRTSATTEWHDRKLKFYALGGLHVVSRFLAENGDLLWDYPSLGQVRMKRICHLPEGYRSVK